MSFSIMFHRSLHDDVSVSLIIATYFSSSHSPSLPTPLLSSSIHTRLPSAYLADMSFTTYPLSDFLPHLFPPSLSHPLAAPHHPQHPLSRSPTLSPSSLLSLILSPSNTLSHSRFRSPFFHFLSSPLSSMYLFLSLSLSYTLSVFLALLNTLSIKHTLSL